MLERNGDRAAAPFGSLIFEPGNNIWAWPGDTIYIYQDAQTFVAFGAAGQQGQFPFLSGKKRWRNHRSGRWTPRPAGRSRFRLPLPARAPSPGRTARSRLLEIYGPTVPIVYNVSFKDPGGYFLATRFQMHNKDLSSPRTRSPSKSTSS